MTDRDDPSPFVSSRHVGDRASSYTLIFMFVASFFRTRYIVTLLSAVFFVLFAGRRDSSRTVTPFGDLLRIGCIGHVRYCNATQYASKHYRKPFAFVARIHNHIFKKRSGKFEVKAQIALQGVQSCSQAVPSVLRLRTESFSQSNLFRRPLLLGESLISGFNWKVKTFRGGG